MPITTPIGLLSSMSFTTYRPPTMSPYTTTGTKPNSVTQALSCLLPTAMLIEVATQMTGTQSQATSFTCAVVPLPGHPRHNQQSHSPLAKPS